MKYCPMLDARSLILLVLAVVAPLHASAEEHLRLGVARSIERTGLLKHLLPPFEKVHEVKVTVVAIGTRKAVESAREGKIDVIIVHKQGAREQLLDKGFGLNWAEFMYNDFVIVGPDSDPAGIRGMKNAAGALRKIAQTQAPFVSRADESEVHFRELLLWRQTSLVPSGPWYMETKLGAGETLMAANYKNAYTISERETWALFKKGLKMSVLCEGDPALRQMYSVITVNPQKHPQVKYDLAKKFVAFLATEETKSTIRSLKVDGEQLFYPVE